MYAPCDKPGFCFIIASVSDCRSISDFSRASFSGMPFAIFCRTSFTSLDAIFLSTCSRIASSACGFRIFSISISDLFSFFAISFGKMVRDFAIRSWFCEVFAKILNSSTLFRFKISFISSSFRPNSFR